jgi:Asp-tRNA(Asn)/Glu-tRNA(Gln) amidotransferase A subunit family amidase
LATWLLQERALAKARAVDEALDAGRPAPALAGVPVAIKDVLDVEGLPTTCGSRILEGYRPPFTATAVARLETAGAVVIGKTLVGGHPHPGEVHPHHSAHAPRLQDGRSMSPLS